MILKKIAWASLLGPSWALVTAIVVDAGLPMIDTASLD
jgi:hypothetical protein